MEQKRLQLYPAFEARNTGFLQVSSLHKLYFEESGNAQGQPVVFLHGGPGSGTNPDQRRYFDPAHYRIILFDQRGAGKSTPHASLEENTTWHLVEDIEKLRKHLGIEKWLVFGGSWGSTLALAYAQAHPDRVTGLIMRGIFLATQREIDWFYKDGACFIYPDVWEDFINMIPPDQRHDPLAAYDRMLTSPDDKVRSDAAIVWTRWEAKAISLIENPDIVSHMTGDHFAQAFARLENHYFRNLAFLKPNQLIEGIDRIRHIPAVIVQGRYDMVCPIEAAWKLHKAWPQSELIIVPDAGHSASEVGIVHHLVDATNRFRK